MGDIKDIRNEFEGLTRISVRSAGNSYIVRNDGGSPVRVRRLGELLECECGRSDCVHVACLRMCGFIEAEGAYDLPRAA